MHGIDNLQNIVTAVGGLGTAAFGLVDATKVFGGGVNHIGFAGIKAAVQDLLAPGTPNPSSETPGVATQSILDTLRANWFNGTDLASQKAIAKSLIYLQLHHTLEGAAAPALARAVGLDVDALKALIVEMRGGASVSSEQSDAFARFDVIMTARLDGAYQHADQAYRNWTRALATLVSIGLALLGGALLHLQGPTPEQHWLADMLQAALVGLMATPLAPIAKDLSTGLATAVNALQLVKK